MNKRFAITVTLLGTCAVLAGCGNSDPRHKGTEAGKAACECYKLEGLEAVEECLDKIERDNQEFLTDTAYTNAVEAQLFECITEGIIDIDKPIKEAALPDESADTVDVAEQQND